MPLIAVPPAEAVEIGSDGTISIRPLGEDATTLVPVDRIKLVNPPANDLEKGQDGLMRLADGNFALADAGVTLAAGSLEGSNVSGVEALVNMIELARQFEVQVKMMRTAEENDSAATGILRL